MSDLIPNIEALIASLAEGGGTAEDALALADAARDATTEDALDSALTELVATWRRC